MKNYIKLLVLLHFLNNDDYSIQDLSRTFGLSIEKMENILDELMEEECLKYKDGMLHITFKGRITLMNNNLGMIKDNIKNGEASTVRKLEITDIYVPENFKLD